MLGGGTLGDLRGHKLWGIGLAVLTPAAATPGLIETSRAATGPGP